VEQLLQAAAAAGPFRLGLDETQLAGAGGAAASSKSVRVGVVKVRRTPDEPTPWLSPLPRIVHVAAVRLFCQIKPVTAAT
jgi:hypothetical protein